LPQVRIGWTSAQVPRTEGVTPKYIRSTPVYFFGIVIAGIPLSPEGIHPARRSPGALPHMRYFLSLSPLRGSSCHVSPSGSDIASFATLHMTSGFPGVIFWKETGWSGIPAPLPGRAPGGRSAPLRVSRLRSPGASSSGSVSRRSCMPSVSSIGRRRGVSRSTGPMSSHSPITREPSSGWTGLATFFRITRSSANSRRWRTSTWHRLSGGPKRRSTSVEVLRSSLVWASVSGWITGRANSPGGTTAGGDRPGAREQPGYPARWWALCEPWQPDLEEYPRSLRPLKRGSRPDDRDGLAWGVAQRILLPYRYSPWRADQGYAGVPERICARGGGWSVVLRDISWVSGHSMRLPVGNARMCRAMMGSVIPATAPLRQLPGILVEVFPGSCGENSGAIFLYDIGYTRPAGERDAGSQDIQVQGSRPCMWVWGDGGERERAHEAGRRAPSDGSSDGSRPSGSAGEDPPGDEVKGRTASSRWMVGHYQITPLSFVVCYPGRSVSPQPCSRDEVSPRPAWAKIESCQPG